MSKYQETKTEAAVSSASTKVPRRKRIWFSGAASRKKMVGEERRYIDELSEMIPGGEMDVRIHFQRAAQWFFARAEDSRFWFYRLRHVQLILTFVLTLFGRLSEYILD